MIQVIDEYTKAYEQALCRDWPTIETGIITEEENSHNRYLITTGPSGDISEKTRFTQVIFRIDNHFRYHIISEKVYDTKDKEIRDTFIEALKSHFNLANEFRKGNIPQLN